MSTTLEFGKYKNSNIIDIFEKDPNYCQWLFKQPIIKQYEEIYNFLESKFKDSRDYYMSFGKYKNKPLTHIINTDPKYIYYLKSNEYVQTKLPELAKIVNALQM